MSEITLDEIKLKKPTSFLNGVAGTIAFLYYVSPIGYLFCNEKHNVALKLFQEI